MANEWVSPTNHVDSSGSWTNETAAYNGIIEDRSQPVAVSFAPTNGWSKYLELTIDAIYCSKVKFYALYNGTDGINSIDLDVYYDGAWHDL